jgi:hypothetical protein
MSVFESKRIQTIVSRFALGFGALSMTIGLGLFAYLGTFTRYLADDYCEAVAARKGLLQPLIQRYLTVSDRYTNLLFSGLLEFLNPHNIQLVPIVMILLWVAALTWLVYQIRQWMNLRWNLLLDFFLASSLAFFSILEAPNRFQTIYWRSAMATHFAPLVYLTAFVALLLQLIRRYENRSPSIWVGMLCLVIVFFGGGFSEPPVAVLIVASALALAVVWFLDKGPRRRPSLKLLSWTLAGGLLALLTLLAAPGNSFRIRTARPDLVELIQRTLVGTIQFILDSFATLPTPTFVSIILPLVLFYGLVATSPAFSPEKKRTVWIITIATPVLAYGFIAASFSPSIYGQGFPAERARFIGVVLWTAALMLEGACIGILLTQWKIRWASVAALFALAILAVLELYPLRTAWNIVQEKEVFYTQWSASWDKRQTKIFSLKAKGEKDIVIGQLHSIEGIAELSPDPNSWINVCAANYYGVHSISAP